MNCEIFKFSNDIKKCEEFIGSLVATGGADTAEDLAGAF